MIASCVMVASFPESIVPFRGALIADMVKRGVEVHVAAPFSPTDSRVSDQLRGLGAQVHPIHLSRTGSNVVADFRSFVGLLRLFRRIRPQLAFAYTLKPVIYGMAAAWLAGVPRRVALVTGLGFFFTGSRQSAMSRLVRQMFGRALGRCHNVIFQNPDDQALVRELGILPDRVPSAVVAGSGIDLQSFPCRPLPSGPGRFLMIARLLGDKGVREFVQAARTIKLRHPSCRFALAGWIDDNPDAVSREELDDWIRSGDVEFLGRLEDVRAAITDCNVYVLPSYREGTPRTVLEAMAMGRPIITSDAPGCRETVVDARNGFLVPVKSVTHLAGAMERLALDEPLRASMGLESRRVAEQKYDVAKVNVAMLREMGIAH